MSCEDVTFDRKALFLSDMTLHDYSGINSNVLCSQANIKQSLSCNRTEMTVLSILNGNRKQFQAFCNC